jgi:hypothetical protein
LVKKHPWDIQFNWSLFRVLLVEIEKYKKFQINIKFYDLIIQAREVTIDEVFLDEARSSDNLREYEQYFLFNDQQSAMET